MTTPLTRSVLFVCMGNICRSPTGEGLFRQLVEDRGLEDRITIDSAGTIAHHAGERPDPRMRDAAARRGYELDGAARQVTREDFDRFDLIVAMDGQNVVDLLDVATPHDGQLQLLSDFLPPGSATDVPDPYYGGQRGFEIVLDMIEEACPAILDHLLGQSR
ncbi:MAG: low molecular weight protein-tyrosine-phosphatase [Acidobacteriota bacterium]